MAAVAKPRLFARQRAAGLGFLLVVTVAASGAAHAEVVGKSLGSPGASQAQTRDETSSVSAKFEGESSSADAKQLADWVARTSDNGDAPFIIVDKKQAKVFVFDRHARLLGAAPALLGLARGDKSAPGVGDKKLEDLRPEERTTAAGRFVASFGDNLAGKDVLWLDYDAALALHRVLPRHTREGRLQRLVEPSLAAHRITFGCINVAVKFYDDVVRQGLSGKGGIVYVLPEVNSLAQVFWPS